MNQTIEAIYEDGVFKPVNPVSNKIEDGEKVRITIKTTDKEEESGLSLTEKYFKGLSEEDIEKVITHALEVSDS
jgi:predicted DNA-binding antitoxin AbrB/MazE fold protein